MPLDLPSYRARIMPLDLPSYRARVGTFYTRAVLLSDHKLSFISRCSKEKSLFLFCSLVAVLVCQSHYYCFCFPFCSKL